MKTVRRLIYGEVLQAVGFVTLAFLALFVFFDLVDELPALGQPAALDPTRSYGMVQALLYVALRLPSHLYDLLPIALLIGSVYGLSRLAQGSEFTILRTSGLGPALALRQMALLGLGFALLTFLVGDYLSPWSERQARQLKALYHGPVNIGQTGAWLKERVGAQRQVAVNVASITPDGTLHAVRIFEFDAQGRVLRTLAAENARIDGARSVWLLQGVQVRDFDTAAEPPRLRNATLPALDWPSKLRLDTIEVALLRPEHMNTWALYRYIEHLQANQQDSQHYEIELWRKIIYPLSCLVMVALALPFAYLHARSQSMALFVFVGIMLGLSFVLLSNMFGYIGNLLAWQPWLAAAAPALLYSLASLAAFGWLVLRR